MQSLFRLSNSVQNYTWGSTTELSKRFGIANSEGKPQAEIWIGAHPKAPSMLYFEDRLLSLKTLIDEHRVFWLGKESGQISDSRNLPFLFKVLAVAEPLSIQVHPGKEQTEAGFFREQVAQIPLNSPSRNYPDPRHKPELLYALTPFRALKGFRPQDEIVRDLQVLKQLGDSPVWPSLLGVMSVSSSGLEQLSRVVFSLNEESRRSSIKELLRLCGELPWSEKQCNDLGKMYDLYPDDIGVLAPLVMNYVELQPGQALYIEPGCLHCYLEGTGLEVMASSNNVLRCGLTHKYIDKKELLNVVDFCSHQPETVRQIISPDGLSIQFPVPVDDFRFQILRLVDACYRVTAFGPKLFFCLEGEVEITTESDTLRLKSGQSCILAASCDSCDVRGTGQVAVVS